jgi:hypothetical protein
VSGKSCKIPSRPPFSLANPCQQKSSRPPSPQRDLRFGIIWIGVAAGLAGLGLSLSFESPDATYPLLGIACFPGFIGLAFVLMAYLNRERKS